MSKLTITKERDEENQDLMLTVGRLRVEREELESRTVTVKLPLPACTYADHSYPAYSRAQVVGLLEQAGIKWEAE